jgi:hydroxypyruvate isomerase
MSKTKLSVCVDAVLADYSIDEALAIISRCQIPAFEFWKWWEKDLDALLKARDRYSLSIAACCTKFVSLVDPSKRLEYLEGLRDSIAVAKRLDCPTLISQVGDFRPSVDRQAQFESLVDGLVAAAEMLKGSNIQIAIEPLNELVDHAGYFLIESQEAFQIIEEVNSPNIKVTFDIYHQQISEGNVLRNLLANLNSIAHFHAAGNPGRHELSTGELHYQNIFNELADAGYQGYVGLEYWPLFDAETGLRRIADWVS